MSEEQLSKDLYILLNGKALAVKQHEAMMLLTVSEDGWPHTAMVSVGEIIAINRKELRIGLWPNTSTTSNIVRTGKATLVVFYRGKANYIRLSLEDLEELPKTNYPRKRFAATVVSMREDYAKYAEITSGIRIELKDPKEVVKRWNQTVLDLLQ
ncbi:pyridoxamine 5'-phosphate oxidase family protein [Priestia megaterium]|uniref:Pyridoxamine 5'-phosphate oxidase family protein n=1 Tax=Priestia megaterium TaxID=1404 RepID=A0ABD4WSY8_PRIMG|nr:pyridoxamine 5'-phosphate oxidase family protein [Priestia megaterium]MDD9783126.1 pyridoxamine 5'-phosphate oxidase family protein [Priestia megaterium]